LVELNELPGEVNPSETALTAFAIWVHVLESHLSVKLKEVRREWMHHDAFLSHAGADKPAIKRLANELRAVQCA
jgi:hypothetical protein